MPKESKAARERAALLARKAGRLRDCATKAEELAAQIETVERDYALPRTDRPERLRALGEECNAQADEFEGEGIQLIEKHGGTLDDYLALPT